MTSGLQGREDGTADLRRRREGSWTVHERVRRLGAALTSPLTSPVRRLRRSRPQPWNEAEAAPSRRGHGDLRGRLRRSRIGIWATVAASVTASLCAAVLMVSLLTASPAHHRGPAAGHSASASASALQQYEKLVADVGTAADQGNAVALAAAAAKAMSEAGGADVNGVLLPSQDTATLPGSGQDTGPQLPAGPVLPQPAGSNSAVAALTTLQPADLLVISGQPLPSAAVSAIGRLPGVTATNLVDAAKIEVNGGDVDLLGVDPSTFREFTAAATAQSTQLWQNVADGGIAVSYELGQDESLPLGGTVTVAGARTEQLVVGGFGTTGITGVDAVVSTSVAASLGLPSGNALVISAPKTRLSTLVTKVKQTLSADGDSTASVAPLVSQAPQTGLPATTGLAGDGADPASDGQPMTVTQVKAFLTAALSRLGDPYVWGGDGPDVFDCSGLVQWSMRQAGITMPRVAADQALTGPSVPVSQLEPGDLLFYHTDPTEPDYISHVAIYLGYGLMLQAPETGEDVEVVPASFGSEFAGAVRVYPSLAATIGG